MDSCAPKIRQDFSKEEILILEKAFTDGMNTLKPSARHKIEMCADTLKTSTKRIETWIGNYRRKLKTGPSEVSERKVSNKKVAIQGPNGYSLFLSTIPRGNTEKTTHWKECSEKWKSLPFFEQQAFKERAADVRKDPFKGKSRGELIKHYLFQLSLLSEKLNALNFELGGIGIDLNGEEHPAIFGLTRTVAYLQGIREDFESKMKGFHSADIVNNNNKEKKTLKKMVRKIFNEAFFSADGKKRTQVPYQEISNKTLTVVAEGLPSGTKFQDPSNYSKGTLSKIVEAADKIKLCIAYSSNTSSSISVPAITCTTVGSTNNATEENCEFELLNPAEIPLDLVDAMSELLGVPECQETELNVQSEPMKLPDKSLIEPKKED